MHCDRIFRKIPHRPIAYFAAMRKCAVYAKIRVGAYATHYVAYLRIPRSLFPHVRINVAYFGAYFTPQSAAYFKNKKPSYR